MKYIRTINKSSKPKKIGTFDIETWGLGGDFALGVCISDKGIKTFYSKDEMIQYMLSRTFKNYTWFAHNIKYDVSVMFRDQMFHQFKIIMSDSRLISMIYSKNGYNIYLQDSLNLFPMPLDKIAKAMNLPKLKTPLKFKIPPDKEKELIELYKMKKFDEIYETYGLDKDEIEEFITKKPERVITNEDIQYCIRDTQILYNAINYLQNFLQQFNVRIRPTIGSNALAIFLTLLNTIEKKKYIKVSGYDYLFRNSYYGGRTELFIPEGKNLRYYDFNSLYPSVMYLEQFPDPESLEYTNEPTIDLIEKYEGISYVEVHVPETDYPPLPYKHEGKLIFPCGTFKGWYNHNELRMALKYGVKILNIYKTVYATKTVNYFKPYIEKLYNLRKEYKNQGNEVMNLICKLLMNSLYGKFGQRNKKREIGTIYDEPPSEKHIFQPIGTTDIGYWIAVDENMNPIIEDADHAVLCWASYITSHARIYLYEKIQEVLKKGGRVYYCDTDSLLVDCDLENGSELGQLKLEATGDFEGFAPKVYRFSTAIKIKGVRRAIEIKKEYKEYRILQPLEALRRKSQPATPEIRVKKLKLKNEKRNGTKPLNVNELEKMKRLKIRTEEIYKILKKQLWMYGDKYNLIKTEDGYYRFKTKPDFYYEIENKHGRFTLKHLKEYARDMALYEMDLEEQLSQSSTP